MRNFEDTFTFDNLWKSYKKCIKGVCWKASVQKYSIFSLTNITKAYHQLHNNEFKSKGFYEFTINERGKTRHIKSIHIYERVIQKCLCDYNLTPLIQRYLIYDNGACIKNKGVDFSLNRLTTHLRRYYKENHTNRGYVLSFDFSKYFENINHDLLIGLLTSIIKDERVLKLTSQLIKDFGERGLGLGSQISQICALFYPTILDRYIKQDLKIKYYGRYMDDGYLICNDKAHLRYALKEIRLIVKDLDLKLNMNKTQISKLEKGITWLKLGYRLTNTGKIYRKPYYKNITRMRRKLKKWFQSGRLSLELIRTSYMSWLGCIKRANCRKVVESMNKLFKKEELKWL